MDDIEIIRTSDGSHSLLNTRLNETYHSVHGAVRESLHVFITNGLQYFHERHKAKEVSVLEVGFGTGLNALLTWEYAAAHQIKMHYTTLEPFPLPVEVWSQLNYSHRDAVRFRMIHEAAWNKVVMLGEEFLIEKRKSKLEELDCDKAFDVIYFDAFAPGIQPELWSRDALKIVAMQMKTPAVFVTYSAKGQMKRDLRDLGLQVQTLPGPPGKNEMVRSIKPDDNVLL